jgi:hypothetical protein
MKRLQIDDTGVICETASELAKVLGCAQSLINYCRDYHSDKVNHFWIKGQGITVLQENRPEYYSTPAGKEYKLAYRKTYYQKNKEKCLEKTRQWRKRNPERVKYHREKWRKEHRDWWNAYYREWNKKRKNHG